MVKNVGEDKWVVRLQRMSSTDLCSSCSVSDISCLASKCTTIFDIDEGKYVSKSAFTSKCGTGLCTIANRDDTDMTFELTVDVPVTDAAPAAAPVAVPPALTCSSCGTGNAAANTSCYESRCATMTNSTTQVSVASLPDVYTFDSVTDSTLYFTVPAADVSDDSDDDGSADGSNPPSTEEVVVAAVGGAVALAVDLGMAFA
jgi:hypothetical protein